MEYRILKTPDGTIFTYDKKTNLLHNVDGPAIIWANGLQEYYILGEIYANEKDELFLLKSREMKLGEME